MAVFLITIAIAVIVTYAILTSKMLLELCKEISEMNERPVHVNVTQLAQPQLRMVDGDMHTFPESPPAVGIPVPTRQVLVDGNRFELPEGAEVVDTVMRYPKVPPPIYVDNELQ